MAKKGLGKGLDALIKNNPEANEEVLISTGLGLHNVQVAKSGRPANVPACIEVDAEGGLWCDVNLLKPNPKQPRVDFTHKQLEELFDSQKCAGNYHLMQAFYYSMVLTAEGAPYEHDAVVPALMYCAKNYGDNYSGIIKLSTSADTKKEAITDFKQEFGDAFQEMLSQKIDEIFTPYINDETSNGTFNQCEDDQHCAYCDFLTFCRRRPQKTL